MKITLGQRLHVFLLRLLVKLVRPFSKRTAARFTRSADKRDPKQLALRLKEKQELERALALGLPGGAEPLVDPARVRRILVADDRMPQQDASARAGATLGIITDLCAIGFDVVFCPTNLSDAEPVRRDIEAFGATVIGATSGHVDAGAYLRAEGAKFGAFYLVGLEAAEALMPDARTAAPDAPIVFHNPDLVASCEGRGTSKAGAPAAAENRRARESALINAADHVVLVNPAEYPFPEKSVDGLKISHLGSLSGSGSANVSETVRRSELLRALDRAKILPLDLYIESCRTTDPVVFRAYERDRTIDVSIIMQVGNDQALADSCLRSVRVAACGTGIGYEVLLVDESTGTEESTEAQGFPRFETAAGDDSPGELRHWNAAAARARGRYLLFLRSDTIVLPNWLRPLVQVMDDDRRVAIVGSKSLDQNGAIEEAGGVLYSDGSAVKIGQGRRRRSTFYSLVREVDYTSGSSMLVRRDFWREAEGFDNRFGRSDYRDADLAMTARARGYHVVCQPMSEVVLAKADQRAKKEGDQSAPLAGQARDEFFQKWQGSLAKGYMESGTVPEIAIARAERKVPVGAAARRASGKLNVLYFSPFPSHPDNHGNQATIQAFGRRFREMGHQVHFALLQSRLYDENAVALMQNAWDSLTIIPNDLRLWSNGTDIPFDAWYEEGIGERIRLLCAKYDIDLVFCSYVFQSKLLDYVPEHVLKVIDTHDKMGGRYEMLRKNGQPTEFFSCTPDEEGAYLRRADIVVARRAEEAEYFDAVTGRASAIVIPHVEEPRPLDREFTDLANIGLVASANQINLAIVLQFLQAVERRTEAGHPPFYVHIAGQVRDMIRALPSAKAEMFMKPWVKLLGFVPDIGEFYSSVDLVVSPVTMGTGINVKTVQAMAYGMPLLATAWGSKGIETEEPMHNHQDLDTLVDGLFCLAKDPNRLSALAEVSRQRYRAFYEDSNRAMEGMFSAARGREETSIA
ncbi:MAG: glycosyltransferase [Hyphomicrobium sp.]|nr:glycosyltransferase [Hyphomicrobium sp.]